VPAVHTFITNNFVRGAVSGLGLINLISGLGELISILLARPAPSLTLTGQGQVEK
jgi:hypothetical protein